MRKSMKFLAAVAAKEIPLEEGRERAKRERKPFVRKAFEERGEVVGTIKDVREGKLKMGVGMWIDNRGGKGLVRRVVS